MVFDLVTGRHRCRSNKRKSKNYYTFMLILVVVPDTGFKHLPIILRGLPLQIVKGFRVFVFIALHVDEQYGGGMMICMHVYGLNSIRGNQINLKATLRRTK